MTAAAEGVEFGGRCVMGLAEGMTYDTNCNFTWTDPDGKKYCFSTEDAKNLFLEDVDGNLAKARDFYTTTASRVKPTKVFTKEEVKAELLRVIEARTKDGSFRLKDNRTGEDLKLTFKRVKIVRGMVGYGWFPNVIFSVTDAPEKGYALDFWLLPDGDKLVLMDIRIQKVPVQRDDYWIMKTRPPVAWWWLPASEHPGDPLEIRGWKVISAIHRHIKENSKDGVYYLKDEKTGQTYPTQLAVIHHPVRKLKGEGLYFACADFRKVGSKDEFFDVDIWLDDKTGRLGVNAVKLHKIPVLDEATGTWSQKPLFSWDEADYDKMH